MEVTTRTSNDTAKRQRLQDINVIAHPRAIARCNAGSAIAVVAWRIHLLATSRGAACGGRGIDGQHLIYKLKGRPLRMLAASPVAGCASNSPYSRHSLNRAPHWCRWVMLAEKGGKRIPKSRHARRPTTKSPMRMPTDRCAVSTLRLASASLT